MNKEMITLNMKEQRTNDIMIKLISKEISMHDAISLTGLTEKRLYRKKKLILKMVLILFHINLKVNLTEKNIRKN